MTSRLPEPVIKQVEKEILRESKTEERNLAGALNDLVSVEKAQVKAMKAAQKAETVLGKSEKKEVQAAKDLNKATYKHDVAVNNMRSAEKDLQKFHQRTQQVFEAKKSNVDNLLQAQQQHSHEREQKLSNLRSGAVGAGQNAPMERAGTMPGGVGPFLNA